MDPGIEASRHLVDIPPRITIEEVKQLLQYMVDHGGSDLFLMGSSAVYGYFDDRLERMTRRELTEEEVLEVLKTEAIYGINAPSRLGGQSPIDASFEFRVKSDGANRRYRFRVNAVSCQRRGRQSLTVTFRAIPGAPPRAEEIGVEEDILRITRGSDQGLILVTGATGNGKSTLLGSIIRDQAEEAEANRNIVTIEHPIEFVYDEIDKPTTIFTPIQVDKHLPSFADAVRNAMRMAPTTILIGESRDYETVRASVEASVTGHVVFSTVHTNSVPETLQRLVALYPAELQGQARLDILQALRLVITQRLVPREGGGRIAIREYLAFDQHVKDEILESENLTQAVFKALARHGRSMTEDAREKHQHGLISDRTLERQLLNYREEVGDVQA